MLRKHTQVFLTLAQTLDLFCVKDVIVGKAYHIIHIGCTNIQGLVIALGI